MSRDISFCCLQETWLSGDDLYQVQTSKDADAKQCIFFHHGQPKQVGRGSGGVGILLTPLGVQA
eukprot:14177201-Ditylum_brightwellii.AAC.1